MTYSGFWIRFVAAIIDGIIVGVIASVFLFAGANQTAYSAFDTVIGWVYYTAMTATRSQTLGKMAVGIKVIREDGSPPDWTVALIREVPGKIVSGIVFLLGYIWAGFDAKKQAWHDKIAKTYVVPVR